MKKSLILLLCGGLSLGAYAQEDDVYYVPSKESKINSQARTNHSSYEVLDAEEPAEYDNWAARRSSTRDVDEYNRRGKSSYKEIADTNYVERGNYVTDDDSYDDNCTYRIVRFHSPRVGIWVSSPFYADFYDYWYDPFYDPYYYSWYGGWYNRWYGWNYRPWAYWGWYGSWYGSGWGWSWSWYPGGWYHPGWGYGYAWHNNYPIHSVRNWERGPVGGGRMISSRQNRTVGRSSYGGYDTGTYGRSTVSSRSVMSGRGTYNNNSSVSGRSARTWGRGSSSEQSPSRSYTPQQSTRSYTPSQSNGSGRSMGVGSSSGGGRSMGSSGGGRSTSSGRVMGR